MTDRPQTPMPNTKDGMASMLANDDGSRRANTRGELNSSNQATAYSRDFPVSVPRKKNHLLKTPLIKNVKTSGPGGKKRTRIMHAPYIAPGRIPKFETFWKISRRNGMDRVTRGRLYPWIAVASY